MLSSIGRKIVPKDLLTRISWKISLFLFHNYRIKQERQGLYRSTRGPNFSSLKTMKGVAWAIAQYQVTATSYTFLSNRGKIDHELMVGLVGSG